MFIFRDGCLYKISYTSQNKTEQEIKRDTEEEVPSDLQNFNISRFKHPVFNKNKQKSRGNRKV